MPSDSERYAMIGYSLTSELIRRHRAGRPTAAKELERAVSTLINAKPAAGFKRFIAEEAERGDLPSIEG